MGGGKKREAGVRGEDPGDINAEGAWGGSSSSSSHPSAALFVHYQVRVTSPEEILSEGVEEGDDNNDDDDDDDYHYGDYGDYNNEYDGGEGDFGANGARGKARGRRREKELFVSYGDSVYMNAKVSPLSSSSSS